MNNTIILLKGEARLTDTEYKKFTKGDTIWGNNAAPEEIGRWSIDQKADALQSLCKYSCFYKTDGKLHNITEYALEYCECDADGAFIEGSDFDLAEEMVCNGWGRLIDFPSAIASMDPDIREVLHRKMPSCTDQDFFDAYAKAHKEKYNEPWALTKLIPRYLNLRS